MKMMMATFALGTALVLCQLASSPAVAQARTDRVVPRARLFVPVPVERPYWDSYVVPRYRYRPEDDRVDPYGPPVVPVIRLGDGGEIYLSPWY